MITANRDGLQPMFLSIGCIEELEKEEHDEKKSFDEIGDANNLTSQNIGFSLEK